MPDIMGPACLLTLSAGKLTLSLRSPTLLPKCLEVVAAMLMTARTKLDIEERRVLADAVQGPARIYWWTSYCALQVTAEISGLSRLIRS